MDQNISIDQFMATSRAAGWRHELVDGKVIAEPWHERRGMVAFALGFHIESYLQERPRGRTFRPSPVFQWNAGCGANARIPDLAFLAAHRLAELDLDGSAIRAVPDFVADVVVDPAQWSYAHAKAHHFLCAGAAMAWVVDDGARSVAVYRPERKVELYRENDKPPGASVFPHLTLRVFEIWD
jgi:Uma2 family endonuclease